MDSLKSLLNSKKFLTITNIVFISAIIFLLLRTPAQKISFDNIYQNKIIHDNNGSNYTFTNPVLDCESVNQGGETVINRIDLNDKVETLKSKYNIDLLSVYFRDLNNGPWVGIKEKELFSPASLLKTPYFIAFLHYAEDNPSILEKKIILTKDDIQPSDEQNIKPSTPLESGKEYTLREIAERTIIQSDNTGFYILIKTVPKKYLDDIYNVLGNVYSLSSTNDSEIWIRVKDAASLFRILFNSSYLSREASEYALKIFSKSEFKGGIVAGVPDTIKVAHKFGERIDTTNIGSVKKTTQQIHDCGIVYYPDKPYILCIMTRGNDIKNQTTAIAEISKFIYNEVDKSR